MDPLNEVVQEFFESERKYLQDLEVLQNYRRVLHTREILPSNRIRALFKSLDSLNAFERRFLAGVESNARLPSDEQRFGLLFTSLEDGFSCYENYCANLSSANQLVQDENAILSLAADILQPKYELPVFLIKPYGRLFKNLLFIQRLLSDSDPSRPRNGELEEGFASMTRVIDKVNQVMWQREKEMEVNDLNDRVDDWKGHDVFQFGELVLKDAFPVIRKGSEREYHVYLFERIILFCKEAPIKLDKKPRKRMNLQKVAQISNPILDGGGRKKNLQLKGRIFTTNVISAIHSLGPSGSPHNSYLLQAKWRSEASEEYFTLKCQTEEQLNKWKAAINKAANDAFQFRRRRMAHLYSLSRAQSSRSPTIMHSEIEEPSDLPGYSLILGIQNPFAFLGHDNDNSSIRSGTLIDEEENFRMSFANTRLNHLQALARSNPSNRVRLARRMFLCG